MSVDRHEMTDWVNDDTPPDDSGADEACELCGSHDHEADECPENILGERDDW